MKIVTVVLAAAIGTFSAEAEAPFAFRERMLQVHRLDRRDPSLKAAADEYEFRQGAQIVIADDAAELVCRAAADFADYLIVSMGVNASVRTKGAELKPGLQEAITVTIAPADKSGYQLETGKDGVCLTATDAKMVAQGFYHLEDRLNLRRAPYLKFGVERRSPRFRHRMVFPGYGNNIAPDQHLNSLAHHGFTGIEIWLADYDVISQGVRQDVNDLIARAAKFGLEVFFQPRNRAYVHPDDPAADQVYDQAYGALAKYYPGVLGSSYCGEVCEFPSKDPHTNGGDHRHRKPEDTAEGKPYPGWYPCYDWADWAKKVSGILHRYNPGYKFVFSTYNWGMRPVEARGRLVDALPREGLVLMPTFEMFENHEKRNGLVSPVADYSFAFPGPGKYFRTEAAQAKRNGIELWSNCNSAGLTWDHGNIPYEPSPWQWKKRWDALIKAHEDFNLSGLRESHEYAWYPSFIAELEKEYLWEGGMDFETHLKAIAARDYGEANVEKALTAWRHWSRAAADYVPTDDNQYGPCRIGSAYPYNFGGPDLQQGWKPPQDFPLDPGAKFTICWFDYAKPMGGLGTAAVALDERKEALEIELFKSIAEDYAAGERLFREIIASLPASRRGEALRMAALGQFLKCATRTALNVKEGRRAFRAGDRETVLRFARLEYANALEALEAVDADSRLGYLVSSGYTGSRPQIEWKLGKMRELYGEKIK